MTSTLDWSTLWDAIAGPSASPAQLLPVVGPLVMADNIQQQQANQTGVFAPPAPGSNPPGVSSAAWIAIGAIGLLAIVLVIRK